MPRSSTRRALRIWLASLCMPSESPEAATRGTRPPVRLGLPRGGSSGRGGARSGTHSAPAHDRSASSLLGRTESVEADDSSG